MRFHVFDVVVLNELFDATDRRRTAFSFIWRDLMTTRRRSSWPLSADSGRWITWPHSTERHIVINLQNIDEMEDHQEGIADNKASITSSWRR